MFGYTANSGSGEAEAQNQDLKRQGQQKRTKINWRFTRQKARKLFKYEKPDSSG